MVTLQIVERNDGWLQRPTTFDIHVTEKGASFAVQRRYNEFLELEKQLRPQFPELPQMPPRSLIIRRLQPQFLHDRQKSLGDLLAAAVAADPSLSDRALRVFLGLAEDMRNEEIENVSEGPALEQPLEGRTSNTFDCALCMQCFDQQNHLDCHMRFTHGWERVPESVSGNNFSNGVDEAGF